MAIADKLLQLNQAKQGIKAAIEIKGVSTSGVPFTDYASKILEISGDEGIEDEYFFYSKTYYTITGYLSIFPNAWGHSSEVDAGEISSQSSASNSRGIPQYPNGEAEGVIIPNGVESIGRYAFYNWTSNDRPLIIPDSVTSIDYAAFYNWTSNNKPLIIPDSVIEIGGLAFRNWRVNNQPLVIPNLVTSIGSSAFRDWRENNQPLLIPNSVTSIGNDAFMYWLLVPYVEMRAITPPTLGNSNAFGAQNNAPIYVPDESVDDYKTATNWNSLESRIFPMSEKP